MTQIRLQDAYLYADCETISDSAIQCPCGSQHGLMSLATVLDRPEKKTVSSEKVQSLLDALDEVCAVTAIASLRPSRKPSSKHTSTAKGK